MPTVESSAAPSNAFPILLKWFFIRINLINLCCFRIFSTSHTLLTQVHTMWDCGKITSFLPNRLNILHFFIKKIEKISQLCYKVLKLEGLKLFCRLATFLAI
jgi:hypothetical protein